MRLGARVYDPAIGHFLSRDPLLIAGRATASNPYAFAMNDPINVADPSGLDMNYDLKIQSGTGSAGNSGAPVAPLVPNLGLMLERLGSADCSGAAELPPPHLRCRSGPGVAGPQTSEVLTRLWLARVRFGTYAPPGFNYDAEWFQLTRMHDEVWEGAVTTYSRSGGLMAVGDCRRVAPVGDS